MLWAVTQLAGADYAAALVFFTSPLQKIFVAALIGIIGFHAQIGIQVVAEDYVSPDWLQAALIWLTRIGLTLGFVLSVYAVFNLPAGI